MRRKIRFRKDGSIVSCSCKVHSLFLTMYWLFTARKQHMTVQWRNFHIIHHHICESFQLLWRCGHVGSDCCRVKCQWYLQCQPILESLCVGFWKWVLFSTEWPSDGFKFQGIFVCCWWHFISFYIVPCRPNRYVFTVIPFISFNITHTVWNL